jgi:hypothetical protein
MRKSEPNPQKGDLVKWRDSTDPGAPWMVIDFFPWGCQGKHAWALQNPRDGTRRIAFRTDIDWF